jgi:SAM-dependent methyltransferase
MEGYDATTYGRAFADVYDEWYEGVTDVEAAVSTLTELALDGCERARVLELGIGTGRIAVPLANDERLTVVGVDTSEPMLDLLSIRDRDGRVEAHLADMIDGLPDGPFDLVLVAYNTLFNLTGDGERRRCFEQVAARLRPGGRFVVEAFVPDEPARDGDDVSIRTMTADRVVLSISRQDATRQTAEGQFVELTEAGGVRLRPWSIRYATPDQLDDDATAAGLELESRWVDMTRAPLDAHHDRHVTVYRRPRHDPDEEPIYSTERR